MSLFEPDRPDPPPAPASPLAGGQPLTGLQAPRPTPWGRLLAASAAALVVAIVLGFAVGSERSDGGEPAAATAAHPPATQPAPVTSVTVRSVASSACLETASRGDEIIDLLVSNRRSQAAHLLEAYTIASRQCRRDASP